VQDTVEHGGEAAGPVVHDIVKMFYDKRTSKTQQQATTAAPAQPDSGGSVSSSLTPTRANAPLVAAVGGQRP